MSGAIPLHPYIPSWCGQRKFYRNFSSLYPCLLFFETYDAASTQHSTFRLPFVFWLLWSCEKSLSVQRRPLFFSDALFLFVFPTMLQPMANHPFPVAIVSKVEEPEGQNRVKQGDMQEIEGQISRFIGLSTLPFPFYSSLSVSLPVKEHCL